jgi:hypothetical protein
VIDSRSFIVAARSLRPQPPLQLSVEVQHDHEARLHVVAARVRRELRNADRYAAVIGSTVTPKLSARETDRMSSIRPG